MHEWTSDLLAFIAACAVLAGLMTALTKKERR